MVSRDDIIRMAREAGVEPHPIFGGLVVSHSNGSWINIEGQLQAIADSAYAAGSAAEREECAKIAWERFGTAGREIAGAIRARK